MSRTRRRQPLVLLDVPLLLGEASNGLLASAALIGVAVWHIAEIRYAPGMFARSRCLSHRLVYADAAVLVVAGPQVQSASRVAGTCHFAALIVLPTP